MELADPAGDRASVRDADFGGPRGMQERPACRLELDRRPRGPRRAARAGPWRRRSRRASARRASRRRRAGRSGPQRAGAARRSATAGCPRKRPPSGPPSAGGASRQIDAARLEDRQPVGAAGEVVGGDVEQPADQVRAHHRLVLRERVVNDGPARCDRARRPRPGPGSTKLQVTASSRPASRSRSSSRRSSS